MPSDTPNARTKDPDDKAKQKWDVEAPHGPTRTIAIDTSEGTWMSLDVHPAGHTIVFDLLGDLYTIPIEGGAAKALTSGVSWDMQPRYSPDGEWIAFTSDRDGADNIWIVAAAGGSARQVTKEDFRLVNNPAWTPDGQFIAARKHFTAQRSLGSGEIWLYHVSGTKGLQLSEKPNDQTDVGEPAFSPDGRYLYYSQDVSGASTFEYNKDPHAGIYAIKRLDTREDRTITMIGGAGGAVRPTPSPDGRKLAYVGRSGLDTALFVYDLQSGARHLLYRGLDRDMQETWAIHGVYPGLAWTPDNRSIVFWAGGRLHRIDEQSRAVTEIPFSISDRRTVTEPLRFPIEVHPNTFETKMLRWAEVAPDGKSVVFQALGHLYVRALPDGTPHRLTRDDDVFEFYPSFSRDGRSIVYTTWNDESLGTVRVVPARGGASRTISKQPGHYLEPVFTPDGDQIVVRKVGGGRLRSRLWSHDPGLYALDRRSGASRLVTREGELAHFGADPERVFFLATEGSGDERKFVLKSIELSGAHERVHLRSTDATEFRVAPDGNWVAFRERFNVFVIPFAPSGRPYEVGPKTESVPIAKVSKDAGAYVHWSGDASVLHWSWGPQLFSQPLTDAFEYLRGPADAPAPVHAPAPDPSGAGTSSARGGATHSATPAVAKPEPRVIDIGFSTASDVPTGTIALVGGRIATMKGQEVIERGTIVVTGNRIAAVGASDAVAVPAGAHVVDVGGHTIVPGFIDVHAHGSQASDGIVPQQNWLHLAMLAFGVTTVHDPSHETAEIFAAAELARAGMITAPRIFSTGTILYGAKSRAKAVVESLDDARSHLRRMKAVGAFSVKSYNQPRRNQRQQILQAARELQMTVVPEGGSLFHHNMTMIVDGHTGIEHALPVGRGYRDVLQLWSGTPVGYTPTLVVGYGGLFGEQYWYAHTDVFAHGRLRRFVPPWLIESLARRRVIASRGDWNHVAIARFAKELLDAGVNVQAGAHGQREGLAFHWELWMLVQGGMTPNEALRTGTLAGARYLGLDGDLGSLEPNKLADLIVIDGNPLADIRVSERVRYTMVNGRLYDAATMDELGNRPRARKPLFWQHSGG